MEMDGLSRCSPLDDERDERHERRGTGSGTRASEEQKGRIWGPHRPNQPHFNFAPGPHNFIFIFEPPSSIWIEISCRGTGQASSISSIIIIVVFLQPHLLLPLQQHSRAISRDDLSKSVGGEG